jgi:hypothetical protein
MRSSPTKELAMNSPAAYQPSLTAAFAREHVNDLLRAAGQSYAASHLPADNPHRTSRRRPTWWQRTTLRSAPYANG